MPETDWKTRLLALPTALALGGVLLAATAAGYLLAEGTHGLLGGLALHGGAADTDAHAPNRSGELPPTPPGLDDPEEFAVAAAHAPDEASNPPADAAEPADAARQPFEEWPTDAKPDLLLVLSGETHGYLQPCGCTEGQIGGLAHREGFLNYVRNERRWPVLAADMGDLIDGAGAIDLLRYDYLLEALQALDYAALGVGRKDLVLGVDGLFGRALNYEAYVAANLGSTDPAVDEYLPEIFHVRTVERNGVKVALGSVLPPTEDIAKYKATAERIDAAVPAVLERMAGADVKVLMLHLAEDEAVAFAEKHPGFDVVQALTTHEAGSTKAHRVGGALVVAPGHMGKEVWALGYFRNGTVGGEPPRWRTELMIMNTRFEPYESGDIGAIYARFIDRVRTDRLAEKVSRLPAAGGDAYVGAARCGECHTKAYAKWRTSKHAHAYDSLVHAKPPGLNANPECLACHTTGWAATSGFVDFETTPHLAGNGCENCHGPGKRHSDDPRNRELAAALKLDRLSVEPTCVKCHDAENSVHFDFAKYWPQVAHPWRD